MVTELEKQDHVSAERVDFIDKCLRDIGRVDLARRVNVNAAAGECATNPEVCSVSQGV